MRDMDRSRIVTVPASVAIPDMYAIETYGKRTYGNRTYDNRTPCVRKADTWGEQVGAQRRTRGTTRPTTENK